MFDSEQLYSVSFAKKYGHLLVLLVPNSLLAKVECLKLTASWDTVLQTLQRGVLRFIYTALDYAQTGLIASVFLFKVSFMQINYNQLQ